MSFFIDRYHFGNISINGTAYSKDVLILSERIRHPWWRKEGHLLQRVDLQDIEADSARVIVVGTGAYGVMKVPPDTYEYVAQQGYTIYVEKTEQAVTLFNEMQKKEGPVLGAFHLTC
ncbi:Mth938-like domain-containing protein [candidate division CSSED10-310 bacterium]|uniref:Mth938-like domain-containing protein n=1 Tax=candidate division CSSED10-310 bacterium TaxID=2855610 RepID=A0ABV6YRK2_UNCC1